MRTKIYLVVALSMTLFACSKSGKEEKEIPDQETALTQAQGLKGQNHLLPGVDRYRLVVKFKPEEVLDIKSGQPLFANARSSSVAGNLRVAGKGIHDFTYQQVFPFSSNERQAMQQGRVAPVAKNEFDRQRFRGMAYVKEAPDLSGDEVLNLARAYEALDIVEYAALEPLMPPPPPATPDFTSYQTYRYDVVPGVTNARGVNIEYAWSLGVTGAGVRIADIEWGYNKNHEDFAGARTLEILPPPDDQYKDHGTAVVGILVAKPNTFGMTGMVHGADSTYVISERVNGRASGIATGLLRLRAGDVFLYEMQTGGQGGNYVPADYNQAVWDITKTATQAGIIIVAAAGNGNQDLDASFYTAYRNRGDNGAIIVGAGTRVGRNKASFSTYGSKVHVQGWGDWTVASTGYTSLYNGGVNAGYTSDFSGTSSATPIVASAIVAIQSWHKAQYGTVLTPAAMRTLLINTGTAQGTGGHIGPLPNVGTAIQAL